MLSRVAGSLYWMSRYVERSGNNARTLSSQLIRMLEDSDQDTLDHNWEVVLEICASKKEYSKHYSRLNSENVLHYFVRSQENENSLFNLLELAREKARESRTIIPESIWELMNRSYLEKKVQMDEPLNSNAIQSDLDDILDMSTSFQGIIESSMLRGEPYIFIKIGKWIERAETTARILKVICEKATADKGNTDLQVFDHCLHALQVANGYDSFIMEHKLTLNPYEVITFLIEEERFPRSIMYCVEHTLRAVEQLNPGKSLQSTEELLELLANTKRGIERTDVAEMTMDELLSFLKGFQDHCDRINEVFSATYNLDSYKRRSVESRR
ncbi:alpha-E domain-containing protein [Halobacillus mangrovi]|uniref:alpha-E domain-containing protein n=1 Tax=Halobacillus mangrovi TaxID=402384 RepID=UPI003D988027